MNIITLLTLLQYKTRVFSVRSFLLCFVVGKHASHSLEEIEDIEKGNVFSCKKNLKDCLLQTEMTSRSDN